MENKLQNIGERFKKYLDYKGLSVNQAGNILKFSNSQVYNIVNGKNYGVSKLIQLFDAFNDLRADYLIKGNGNMLSDDKTELLMVNEPTGDYESATNELKMCRETVQIQKKYINKLEIEIEQSKKTSQSKTTYK